MSSTISGSNAISGLGGADTNFDQVLENLRKVESTKLNKLQAWKSDWQLRYDAFTQIVDQVKTAYSVLNNLANKNNFVSKSAISTDDAIITAVANAAADDVQHKITVSQMANNAVWANTNAIFSSKTDLINDTGTKQVFSFDYGGKSYSFDIPNNTTLDSFASMINNSANNPGIKIQLIQANGGYMYQISGNSTGADNDLVIHNSGLKGMDATGTKSTWQTNNALKLDEAITNPTNYVYRLTLNNGTVKDVAIKGDATPEDLKKALENSVGAGLVSCEIDPDTGKMTLGGVASFTRYKKGESVPRESSLKLKLNGDNANNPIVDADTDFTVTMKSGGTRTVKVKAGTTYREFMTQLGEEANLSGAASKPALGPDGWSISLNGVDSITGPDGKDISELNFTATPEAGVGTIDKITSASTTLTFADPDATLGTAGETLRFAIMQPDGGARYVEIDGSKTYKDLQRELGGDPDAGATVTLDNAVSFTQIGGNGALEKITGKTESTLDAVDFALEKDGDTGDLHLEPPPVLKYSVTLNDGTVLTKKVPSGTSMDAIIGKLNEASDWMVGDQPYSGSALPKFDKITDEAGNTYLQVENIQSMSGPGVAGQIVKSDNWQIQTASNAKYFVDNWPVEMESSSNSVSDVIEGVVFNITGIGAANLSVSTDIASVEQSIQTFLDAVNSVIYTVNELTKYDEDKEVTTYDPNDIGKSNYSTSMLTAEKGGLLTGNYGVQLFKSRFTSMLSSSPAGFQRIGSAENVLSGDLVSTLASLGIKTDSDTTSQTYGLLVIAPSSSIAALQSMDSENYENMINNHLRDVVDFFCTTGSGASTSPDFRYGSHVAGITKAGVYDVTYSVSDAGEIEHVYVGGVEATRDTSQPGYYYSVASGDPRGLSFQIDDLTPGDHSGGQIRIKEGMVQTVATWMKGELTYNDVSLSSISDAKSSKDAIHLMSQNGALMSLRANYQGIMNNIDKAISKEETRLDMWYNRQKKVFANLETLLKQYSQQQTSLEAQIKQLGGNS